MTRFSARTTSQAEVEAPPEVMWAVLTDPDQLAALTPLVSAITATGDRWTWRLSGISGLGVSVAPSFTVTMRFDEPRKIEFAPVDDPDAKAAATGVYLLDALAGDRTHLLIDLTLSVDLPLPRLARRGVERVMLATMTSTGRRFATNLTAQTGIRATPPRPADQPKVRL